MDKDALSAWLGKLSPEQKVTFLLHVMHGLTIEMRSIFYDYAENWRACAELSYDLSELNHRLTSAALSMLENEPTYSDEDLIALISVASGRPELSPYLSLVLESAIRRMIATTS